MATKIINAICNSCNLGLDYDYVEYFINVLACVAIPFEIDC